MVQQLTKQHQKYLLGEQNCQTFRDELCTKENWLSTEDVAADKYGSLLEAFEQAKANVGSTYRNRHGFDVVNAVHSDMILADQKMCFQGMRYFSLNVDLGTDKAGRPQEAICLRGEGLSLIHI